MTSLTDVALKIGANRVVRGVRFSHPCGDPTRGRAAERELRLALVREALEALRTPVDAPTLFERVNG